MSDTDAGIPIAPGPGQTTGPDVDYALAVVAVFLCLGAILYVHYGLPGPDPGQKVFASTAGPPAPVRWNAFSAPECPGCGGHVANKADRCTHCGRCVAWCTAPCHACNGSGQIAAVSSAAPLGGGTCICEDCCGNGLLGDD